MTQNRRKEIALTGRTAGRALDKLGPAAALFFVFALPGCMQNQSGQLIPMWGPPPAKAEPPPIAPKKIESVPAPEDDPNIVGVRKFISQEPWLSFNQEGLRQPEGFKATLYLESGTTGRGAFGDGTIRISLYTVDRDSKGERLKLAKRWEISPQDSVPWRARRPTQLGWGYGLRLPWGDAKLAGKEVEFVFQFVRRDGAMLSAEPIRMKVPPRNVRIVTRDDAPDEPGADQSQQAAAPAEATSRPPQQTQAPVRRRVSKSLPPGEQ